MAALLSDTRTPEARRMAESAAARRRTHPDRCHLDRPHRRLGVAWLRERRHRGDFALPRRFHAHRAVRNHRPGRRLLYRLAAQIGADHARCAPQRRAYPPPDASPPDPGAPGCAERSCKPLRRFIPYRTWPSTISWWPIGWPKRSRPPAMSRGPGPPGDRSAFLIITVSTVTKSETANATWRAHLVHSPSRTEGA